mgnify:CR=1 FL=1|tara:strand:- start:244 stop:549 length:306 start_codon:yes stop_codon:yes gene_type:complete
MTKKTVKDFIEDARENVVDDRATTKSLLMNLLKYMQVSDDRHKEVGLIAAKYLETLQRSNEQLVKLAALVQKRENSKDGISEEDKQELFDLINQDTDNNEQ